MRGLRPPKFGWPVAAGMLAGFCFCFLRLRGRASGLRPPKFGWPAGATEPATEGWLAGRRSLGVFFCVLAGRRLGLSAWLGLGCAVSSLASGVLDASKIG